MVPMCVVDYNILATSPGTRPRAKEPREIVGDIAKTRKEGVRAVEAVGRGRRCGPTLAEE